MALETNTTVRGAPTMKCLRVLACNLIVALATVNAQVQAAGRDTGSYPRRSMRQLAQEFEQTAATDFVIDNRFIVVLREDAGDAAAAADALVQRVQASLDAAAGGAAAAAAAALVPSQLDDAAFDGAAQAAAQPGGQIVRVLRTLGSSSGSRAQDPAAPSDVADSSTSTSGAAAAASASDNSSSGSSTDQGKAGIAPGFEALLLAAPPSALEHIRRQTSLVSAVFRDRIVLSQSRLSRRSLSSSSSSEGSEGSEPVLTDGPAVAAAASEQLLQQEQPQPQPQPAASQDSAAATQQAAGSEQPQLQPDNQQVNASDAQLEAQVWGSTRDNNDRSTDSLLNRGSTPSSPLQPLTFGSKQDGNNNNSNRPLSRPNRRRRSAPRPSAPADDNSDALQRLRTGPEPAPAPAPAPAPVPAPSISSVPRPVAPDAPSIDRHPVVNQMKQLLRRQGLAAGEQVPAGIAFIEAATADAVPYTGGAMQGTQQQVTVAVVDSGVDANHPDLVYAGGKSWVRQASRYTPGDMTDPGVDFYGHGTHVAGIIGARNTGRGVVGVAPGMPVFSLKVLDGSGQGALSDALAAVRWAAGREGQSYNIKVINLSIAAYVSSGADDADDTLRIVCQIFREASDAGVLVVTAAGNYRDSLLNYVPAACPTVATVTAMDPSSRSTSAFSNYLPAYASAADKARVMAAPGSAVLSTMSIQRERSRYRELSGTSQASPHVAGIAATCIQSGACPLATTGMQKLAIIQAAAVERVAQRQPYGFRGDPVSAQGATSAQYYGFLAWSKFWDG